LKGFEQDGLIKLIDKDIEVIEREALKEISKRG
jgi:hypothetical protein